MVWLDELLNQVGELLLDPKILKLKTHNSKKNFVKKVKSLIKDSIDKQTAIENQAKVPEPPKVERYSTPNITRPHPNPEKIDKRGVSVMTEELSAKGDRFPITNEAK